MTKRTVVAGMLLTMGAGCAPEVPEKWKDLVIAENLERSFETMSNQSLGDVPGVVAWYDAKKVDAKKLRADYRARFEKDGYELLLSCGSDKPYDAYVKPGNGFIDFSANPLTADTIDVQLNRTDKPMSFIEAPEKSECEWTAAADKVCESRVDRQCTFKKG